MSNIIVLSAEQESFLLNLGFWELLDIYPKFESDCESFCIENKIDYPIYTLQKSKEYYEFLKNIVLPTSTDYHEAFHQDIINHIDSKDEYKKELIELFNIEIEVA